MARKKGKKRTYNPNAPGNGKKLGPTVKKQGILKGPGVYLAKQTGLKAFKTITPLFLMIAATSAVWPGAAAQIVKPLQGIPLAGEFGMLAMQSGMYLRSGMK
ncbi:MAG TPA: hypothetical protein EYN66_12135 [Myxococcales bacterium]|nr:hypothetical protein [Myxococcales bacterium]